MMSTVGSGSVPPRAWTVLLYSAADNDQKVYNIQNVAELETVGSDDHTAIVAQVDTGDQCSRYLVQKAAQTDLSRIQSPALETTGPVDMSKSQTLADFVAWGMEHYPAQHTMVIVSDHGSGWQGAVEDDSHDDWMSMPAMREAFEQAAQRTGKTVDIIGFDACLMASTEVAHELKDVCRYVVGSEDYEDSAGWPYVRVFGPDALKAMRTFDLAKVELSPAVLARTCVEEASTRQDVLPTMSAIDTAAMPAVAEAFSALGTALKAHPETSAAVAAHADASTPFDAFRDATDFLRRVSSDDHVAEPVRSAALQAETAVTGAILAEQHAPQNPGAHGLTIEASSKGLPEGYAETRFARETGWGDALVALQQAPPTSS